MNTITENQNAASLERLRLSKQSCTEQEHAKGLIEGKAWALETAEYDQLERVATLTEAIERGDDLEIYDLACAYLNQDQSDTDSNDVDKVTSILFGEDVQPSSSRVEGFIEGASEVFGQV